MKSLKYYLNKAYREHWAMGQFNFSDFNQVKGVVAAAQNLKAPIILGTSEGESKFIGLKEAVAIRNVLRAKTGLPIFLNLDHGKSFSAKGGSASGGEYSYIKEAVLAGYDMVHFDGSKLPLEENIEISKKVVNFAKKKGVVVEGEVGRFGTDASRLYQEKFEIKEKDLTNPKEAEIYLQKTGVDVLAVSVGTFHGIDITGVSPHIRLDRLGKIRNIIDVPLVLHGGSGTPEEDIKKAIRLGIVKININTEIRVAFANALRKSLAGEIVPYKYLPEAINSVQAIVEEKIKLFGCQNKA
ncbi:MAG: class II fructose-bisphosphate aldolase [Candidatus Staskawiczbacteria bacterium]|nr:class II fructose-bisphosphate aldolase [Candidatus Staskawiczbacteria bacterium]